VTPPTITVTAPNGGESYVAGSSQTLTWTTSPAQSSDLFAVWAVSTADEAHIWLGSRAAVDGQTDYSLPWSANLPVGTYRIRVSFGSLPSTWWATDYSDTAFAVTAPPPTITVPSITGSYPQNTGLDVSWTTNVAASSGEFAVWARSDFGWYIGKLVANNGTSSYATSVNLTVPQASGYSIIVGYRPLAGSGAWTVLGQSSGTFTVGP